VYHDLFRRVKQTGMVCQLQEAYAVYVELQHLQVLLLVIRALQVTWVLVLARVGV
jgi:hypothetical protein